MTHREFILKELLDEPIGLSTTQLFHIAKDYSYFIITKGVEAIDKITEPKVDSYASILAKLRKEKVVYVSKRRAIRGDMIYVLRKYYTKEENFKSLM